MKVKITKILMGLSSTYIFYLNIYFAYFKGARMRRILGCFIFFMMMTSQIFAGTVYYVDATNGNDLNDGLSEVSAWKTIARINSRSFSAGDFILFKRGEEWREQLVISSSGTSGHPITFGTYGSGNKPIIMGSNQVVWWSLYYTNIWRASLTSTPEMVFFDESGTITWGDQKGSLGALVNEYDWYYDSGINLLYVYAASDPDSRYTSVEASLRNAGIDSGSGTNRTYITIKDLEIKFGKRDGIIIRGTSGANYNNIIDSCTIHHIGDNGGSKLGDGIEFHGVSNNTAKNNIVYECGRHGIFVIGYGNPADDNIIESNTVYDHWYGAIDLLVDDGNPQSCDGNIVRYNYVYGTNPGVQDFSAIHAQGQSGNTLTNLSIYYNICRDIDDHAIKIDGNVVSVNIYNNVIFNTNVSTTAGIRLINGTGTAVIKNNIIYEPQAYAMHIADSTNKTIDNNCSYQSGGFSAYVDGAARNWTYWQGTAGFDTNGINSDPKFVNSSESNFHPHSDSPCIDAGTYVGLVGDYAGNTVPYGWGVDVGAYEYTGASHLDAEINASPKSGWAPLTVNFAGSASGGTEPYSYSWDFGDGASSSEQIPSHTYSQAGDYTVTLTVTDRENNQDDDSLIINASAVIAPLAASFIASPTSGEVPLTVNFTGNATGGVLPYSYSWDFGDGTYSSEQNSMHTYSEAGDYTVTLTVTDSEDNQDENSLIINVFVDEAYISCSPKSLFFEATTSGNETTDQYLRIINAGGSTLTWNIADGADWLSCSPSSGTDRGEITVSVSASGLSLGLYVATITVSSPEAYNSPQYVSVNLRVYEPEQESPPFGSLDTSVNGSTVSGTVPITGWALDDDEIGARYFFIDNIKTGSAHHGSFGLRSIYREDAEGRLRIGIKEVRKEYGPQVDNDREIDTKSILKIQIEEMEPLRIVLEGSSGGNIKYIGWGENEWKALPVGSTLDREKGIFLWIPTPGLIGRYVLHFAVTDGSYMSKPLRVVVNVIPKKDRNKENL